MNEIVENMLSKDSTKVWKASSEMIHSCRNKEVIDPLIPYLSQMKAATKNLEIGGKLLSNQRIVHFAFQIIDFYKNSHQCSCHLYPMSGEDTFFNPKKEEEKGNVKIIEIVKDKNDQFVEYYIVECTTCHQRYKIIEGMYHYVWWKWMMM